MYSALLYFTVCINCSLFTVYNPLVPVLVLVLVLFHLTASAQLTNSVPPSFACRLAIASRYQVSRSRPQNIDRRSRDPPPKQFEQTRRRRVVASECDNAFTHFTSSFAINLLHDRRLATIVIMFIIPLTLTFFFRRVATSQYRKLAIPFVACDHDFVIELARVPLISTFFGCARFLDRFYQI